MEQGLRPFPAGSGVSRSSETPEAEQPGGCGWGRAGDGGQPGWVFGSGLRGFGSGERRRWALGGSLALAQSPPAWLLRGPGLTPCECPCWIRLLRFLSGRGF